MPLPVTCPSCTASFKVKDEYAGKKAKCPKCGESLMIPTAFQVAETLLDPPSVKTNTATPKPKPAGDAADDSRKPNRRREAGDGSTDAPRSKRRSPAGEGETGRPQGRPDEEAGAKPHAKNRADDGEDEKPRSRERREDDGDDQPKKSALPLILGILGGVLLLCGGGWASVWFGLVVPAAEQAKKANDEKQAELDRLGKELNKPGPNLAPGPNPDIGPPDTPGQVTKQNLYGKLFRGNKLVEVERQLGQGRQADVATVAADAARLTATAEMKARWEQHAALGNVYRFDSRADRVLCVFDQPPDLDGKLIAVLATFGGVTESVFDPPVVRDTVLVTAQALASDFDADEKAAEAKYKDKVLKLTGRVVEVTKSNDLICAGIPLGKMKRQVVVKVGLTFDDWKSAQTLKAGDAVTLTCKLDSTAFTQDFSDSPWEVRLSDGRLQK